MGRCDGQGPAALKSRFVSIPPRLGAFSDPPSVAAEFRGLLWAFDVPIGPIGAWVCLLGGCGWFRPLSAVVEAAELAFPGFVLFSNCP